MNSHVTLTDIAQLAESVDVECKAAQGRDGKGELPDDFWKSYSALANTQGGVIWLGIQEKPRGVFRDVGLVDVERVRKAIWDNLHNRKQVSINLLLDSHIQPVQINGKTVLRVEVPRASRQSKPVHIGSNPLGGTYLRRYEGDYQADDETVRRMLAERVEDSRDERVLKGFDFQDLDMETVAAYRNRFSAVKPSHVWTDLALPDFLERIGATGRNREEGYSGLRLAGLLMFGRAEVIRDALPHYMVDYQERPERLIPDGTWSGNIYDFFRRTYQKLTSDLKIPFQLQEGQRIEDTPVHEALREALVNTLIHADFSGRVSVLVIKRPDMFGFRNPGLMRVPVSLAIQGGSSDCRNRRLQTMFQLVGYGDHAGSGIPKIYKNWEGEHRRLPLLYEYSEQPEQTLMELHMTSLLPEEAVTELKKQLGSHFTNLSALEHLTLVTAVVEGKINHARLREISTDHPTDITKMLGKLVKKGLLVTHGIGRGMMYSLPWLDTFNEEMALSQDYSLFPLEDSKRQELDLKRQELDSKRQELDLKRQELDPKRQELDPKLDHHLLLDFSQLNDLQRNELQIIAALVRSHRKVPAEIMRTILLRLCENRYIGLRLLAELLNREAENLRRRVLNPLVEEGLLHRAFPNSKDPRQAYTSTPLTPLSPSVSKND
jgi:ATP-dependent DNA helicase RecG